MNETTSEASAPDESTSERLSHVEAAVDRIESALARIVPGSHGEAEQRTQARLDRPSSVEEQVRAELAKADREKQAAAARDAERADAESVKERIARLEEKPPAPPRSRRTAALGWGDGRS